MVNQAVYDSLISNGIGGGAAYYITTSINLGNQVASGDMAADMMNLDLSMNSDYAENNPIVRPSADNKAPHWYTTAEAEDQLKAAQNPFDFGVALHKYQDSYSHWQKLGEPDDPGAIWDAHLGNQVSSRTGQDISVDIFSPRSSTRYGIIDAWMTSNMKGVVSEYSNNYVSNILGN
jgi:hypothetical protein